MIYCDFFRYLSITDNCRSSEVFSFGLIISGLVANNVYACVLLAFHSYFSWQSFSSSKDLRTLILSHKILIYPACYLWSNYKSTWNCAIRPYYLFLKSYLSYIDIFSILSRNYAFCFSMNFTFASLFALCFLIFSLSLAISSSFSELSLRKVLIYSFKIYIWCFCLFYTIFILYAWRCCIWIFRQSMLLACSSLRYFRSSFKS